MSSNKPKAQTVNTGGLYGSSTTNKYGTTYNPSDFETQLINQTSAAIPQYLEQLINPSYDSEIFKAQTAQRNKLASQSFENNLINPLASRGLTRGSSVNQLSGQFANSLIDAEVAAMANEDSRVQNVLNSLFTSYLVPYNIMTGLNNQSQGLYANAQQAANSSNNLFGGIANAAGSILGSLGGSDDKKSNTTDDLLKTAGAAAGTYFGGPAGGAAGGALGSLLGGLF